MVSGHDMICIVYGFTKGCANIYVRNVLPFLLIYTSAGKRV